MSKPKKVAIIGPESTGKTSLSQKLAEHYEVKWVREYAREYLDIINRPYSYKDLKLIAKGQVEEEARKTQNANELLICDTNLIVMKVWSEFKYGKCDPYILEQVKKQEYDLQLLMNIDFPWMSDPQREHPDKRKELFAIYEAELKSLGSNYKIISGRSKERLERAIEAIDELDKE